MARGCDSRSCNGFVDCSRGEPVNPNKNTMILSTHELMRLIGYQSSAFEVSDIITAKLISDIMMKTYYDKKSESNRDVKTLMRSFKELGK